MRVIVRVFWWLLDKFMNLVFIATAVGLLALNAFKYIETLEKLATPPVIDPPKSRPLIDPALTDAEMPPLHVLQLFIQLKKASGFHNIGGIYIVPSTDINAFVTHHYNNVYITPAMLRLANTPDQLAYVLGHEIGHVVLGHTTKMRYKDNRRNEYLADVFGLYLVQRIGLNPCEARKVWLKYKELAGMDIFTITHPSATQRAEYLNLMSCIKEK